MSFSYTLEFGLSGGAHVDRWVLIWGDAVLETMVVMQRPSGLILATPYGGAPTGMLSPSALIGAVTQVDVPAQAANGILPILLLEGRPQIAAHLFPMPDDLNLVPSMIPFDHLGFAVPDAQVTWDSVRAWLLECS